MGATFSSNSRCENDLKKTTLIAKDFWFYNKYSFNICLYYFHNYVFRLLVIDYRYSGLKF